jgi:hypothetical protein
MDELIKKYIQVRNKKSQLKVAYEAEVAKYVELQDKIEALILQKFGEMGMESVRTDEGTAYINVRTSVSVADPDAFRSYVRETGNLDLLELRPSKAAVEQHRDATSEFPPGVNWSETRVVNFRKS